MTRCLILLALAGTVHAETVAIDSDRWTWSAREQRIEEHLGRTSVFLHGGIGWVEDAELTDGTIEFEISFSGERGFVGAIWRIQDPRNYEEFYLRPHQSGNPDACQYTPIFNGAAGWQLYHGEGFAAPVELPRDAWIPVRIVFAGSRGEVYIGDMVQPAVAIHELKREVKAGKVGLMSGGFAPAWFSNFRYSKLESQALVSEPRASTPAEPGTVTAWSVSSAFDEKALPHDKAADLEWTTLQAESSGVTNLARVQGVGEGRNTAFARVILRSDKARSVGLRLGYSDRARVYLNDRRLYRGNNGYRSRDYRYLGTIGLFDEIDLALQQGENELRIAVSEDFGGWGLIGVLEPTQGVTVQVP